jgi:hypothetical protein
MLDDFAARAPAGSRFVFEVEENEELAWLPFETKWDWRRYSPAWVGILDVDLIRSESAAPASAASAEPTVESSDEEE